MHRDSVTGAQHRELALLDGMPQRADGATSGEHVDECVELPIPRDIQLRSRLNRRMCQGNWSVRATRAMMWADISGDDPHQCSAIGRADQRGLCSLDRLVRRCQELIAGRKVDPQLDAVEGSPTFHQFGWGSFDMKDPGPGRHPLGGAVMDEPAAAV
ncbi:Uncharacterised protein [Mycobacteroides abscessus subsp. abscessus]|nr:Uncharacterised protein [Mycobacteroides abscessus subsp. abscessus]